MEQQHVWVAATDGTRLAARLFLPDELPAAVLLDALPSRMDDLTASYADKYERLCEEGGFAVCRRRRARDPRRSRATLSVGSGTHG